jgi:hypothetical protein
LNRQNGAPGCIEPSFERIQAGNSGPWRWR